MRDFDGTAVFDRNQEISRDESAREEFSPPSSSSQVRALCSLPEKGLGIANPYPLKDRESALRFMAQWQEAFGTMGAEVKAKISATNQNNIRIDNLCLHTLSYIRARLEDTSRSGDIFYKRKDIAIQIVESPTLFSLIQKDNIPALRLVIEAGADLEARDYRGRTPLFHFGETSEITKILLDYGSNPDAQDYNNLTAAHVAVISGRLDRLKLLIEYGADINKQDKDGQTPLFLAVSIGEKCSLIRLLLDAGGDIDLSDTSGQTPLMLASESGNLDVVRYLMENGANPALANHKGQTALDLARSNGKTEICAELEQRLLQEVFNDNDFGEANPLRI